MRNELTIFGLLFKYLRNMHKSILLLFSFLLTVELSAQSGDEVSYSSYSEFTVYVIPSKARFDWSSPHTLYKSYLKNYLKNLFSKKSYLLGHAFMQMEIPGDSSQILTGMRSTDKKQSRVMVRKQHYGLSILGTGLPGKLQDPGELEKQVERYSRKGDLAFIRFIINEDASERMREFYSGYQLRMDSIGNESCYGGAFWPRYFGEGSGCSAFVISFMDVAGLLREEYDDWRVHIDIPMDLIGGPYNPSRLVKLREVSRTKHWAVEPARPGTDYQHFWIYDPTLIYEWINEAFDQPETYTDMTVTPVSLNKSKGLEIDARHVPIPEESIFMPRTEPSVFIDHHIEKLQTQQ